MGIFCLVWIMCISIANAQTNTPKLVSDTVNMANKLVAEKKIWQANKMLKSYTSRHPKDFDAIWLNAQTNTWLTNYAQADTLFRLAMKMEPGNEQVQMDHIRMLLYMGKFAKANALIDKLDKHGHSTIQVSLLRVRSYYWSGEPGKALEEVEKVLDAESGNTEANELFEEIRQARALKLSLYGSYLLDNQPYEAYYGNFKIEKYRNKYLDLYLVASQYNFAQPTVTDAQWATLNNKMYFPAARLRINYGGGVVKFPSTAHMDWTANVGLTEAFAHHFNLELNAEHSPYMDTRRSVDSSLSVYRFAGKLNFQKREWSAQAAYINSVFEDDNTINTAYAWLLAPVWITPISKFHLGYSISYSNADRSSYSPVKPLSEILNEYNANYKVAGIYDPYFTPAEMLANSLLFSFYLDLTRTVSFSLNGDVGTGTAKNPYLYLAKDSAGPVHVATAYTKDHFNPYNITTGINIHPGNMWQVSARYTYRSTYFFTSNYVSVGIEKGFAGVRKKKTGSYVGSFDERMMDIEQRIKALGSYTDAERLATAVGRLKADLEALKAEQDKKLSISEISPDSDEAAVLQDRREGIEEMIRELGNANNEASMKERTQQLSAISYHGNTGADNGK